MWRWDNQEPFGADTPNGDPNNTGTSFDFPLRFPGQYFDRETNLAYNMARNYSPEIGRYVEVDPLITRGDARFVAEAYFYAADNPLIYVDPDGLWSYNGPPSQTGRLSGEALALANCLEGCLGRSFIVSGGSECQADGRHTAKSTASSSRHCTNQAIDVSPGGLNRTKTFCCAKKCGAVGLGDESNHWHFQTGGNSYGAPDKCECKAAGVDL